MNRRNQHVSRAAAKPLGRKSARRRVRTRTALLLCLAAMAGTLLAGVLGRFAPPALRVWVNAAASLAFFALPAYLGLCEADGDQRYLLMARRLSSAQTLWLCVSGALLVCPMTLLGDVVTAILVMFARALGAGVSAVQGADGGISLLLPTLLASGVIAPVCEELFFRGYLLGALGRYGRAQAGVMTAALFAAAHGLGADTPLYLLLGLLFAAAALRTGSVLAPMLLHMGYNVTLVLLSAMPLSALFAGLTPLSGLVRLFGCAGLVYAFRRAWLARGAREAAGAGLSLSRREIALVVLALLLCVAAQIVSGVTGV